MKKDDSILGNKYGKLLVKESLGNGKYNCVCDCGRFFTVEKFNLIKNMITHCGCEYKNKVECKICFRYFKDTHAFSVHLAQHHKKEINKKEYYLKFLATENDNKGFCVICGNPTTFRNLGIGFLNCCSEKCASKNSLEVRMKKLRGKKQSPEQIKNRVDKINYKEIMVKRKKKMIEKFGVENYSQTTEARESTSKRFKGKKTPRANEFHQLHIIESKTKNGTLKHTQETKTKISNILKKYYNDPNNDVSYLIKNSYTRGKFGYINNLYYRSSYEEYFIRYCFEKNISIQSAENKTFAVLYYKDEKLKRYYPDFYLTDFKCVIEIKPIWRYKQDFIKIIAGKNTHKNYIVFTQEELFSNPENILKILNSKKRQKTLFKKQLIYVIRDAIKHKKDNILYISDTLNNYITIEELKKKCKIENIIIDKDIDCFEI